MKFTPTTLSTLLRIQKWPQDEAGNKKVPLRSSLSYSCYIVGFFFFLSLILTTESCKHFLVKMHLSIENITSYQIKLGLLNSSLLYNDRCFSKQLVHSQKVWKTQPQPFVFSSMTWIDNRLLWKLSDVFTCTHKSHILNKFKRFNLLLSFRMNWKINKETNLISGINFLLNLSQFSH